MTRNEAKVAGVLATAAEDLDATLEALAARIEEEPDELVGFGLSIDHSDAGSSGLGREVILPPEFVRGCIEAMREIIAGGLSRLGVQDG